MVNLGRSTRDEPHGKTATAACWHLSGRINVVSLLRAAAAKTWISGEKRWLAKSTDIMLLYRAP